MLNETPFETVAAAHGICVKTLRRRCDRMKLEYQRYGRIYKFTPAQLAAYQAAHAVNHHPEPKSRSRTTKRLPRALLFGETG